MDSFITLERVIKEKLAEKGMRATPQRLFVAEYIYFKRLQEIEPDKLFMDIRQHKRMTMATLYSTLKLFAEFGIIEIMPKRYKVRIWANTN
jgi:Fe2+ or Zn2+ uptake regulation protein